MRFIDFFYARGTSKSVFETSNIDKYNREFQKKHFSNDNKID